jgi:hypothetical protein
MDAFLTKAQSSYVTLKLMLDNMNAEYKMLAVLFAIDQSKCSMKEFFAVLNVFCKHFQKCKIEHENMRLAEKARDERKKLRKLVSHRTLIKFKVFSKSMSLDARARKATATAHATAAPS